MIKALFNKLFLVKEIRSKEGELHFRRYRLIQTPWFAVYYHLIYMHDLDRHQHDHPWDFTSIILKNGYNERVGFKLYPRRPWDRIKHSCFDIHKIEKLWQDVDNKGNLLVGPTHTLVFTGRRKHDWGYATERGWVNHREYRAQKHLGQL